MTNEERLLRIKGFFDSGDKPTESQMKEFVDFANGEKFSSQVKLEILGKITDSAMDDSDKIASAKALFDGLAGKQDIITTTDVAEDDSSKIATAKALFDGFAGKQDIITTGTWTPDLYINNVIQPQIDFSPTGQHEYFNWALQGIMLTLNFRVYRPFPNTPSGMVKLSIPNQFKKDITKSHYPLGQYFSSTTKYNIANGQMTSEKNEKGLLYFHNPFSSGNISDLINAGDFITHEQFVKANRTIDLIGTITIPIK